MPYNGWSNYETWKINLEIFSGNEYDGNVTSAEVKEILEEILENSPEYCLDLARSFISSVDYHEIANALNDDNNAGDDNADLVEVD